MQYDLKKVLEDKTVIALAWHGEATRVNLEGGNSPKVDVASGDVVKVSNKKAKELLNYSDLWTLEGDVPVEQGWRKAREEAAGGAPVRKKEKKEKKKVVAEDAADLSPEGIGKMKKKAVLAALETLGVEHDPTTASADLKELLLAAMSEDVPVVEATEEVEAPEKV